MILYKKVRMRFIMENNNTSMYCDILNHFGEEKVAQRYDNMVEQLNAFIKRNHYEDKVIISKGVLNQLLIDYFTDIYRLKEFHNIDLANYIKITSYTAYWLVRRKPLQIIQDNVKDIQLAFCNENFALSYILRYLQDTVVNVHDDNGIYHSFISTLSYTLRYRIITPQALELMIEAFLGGQTFQKSIQK